jgi:hypothetical protein
MRHFVATLIVRMGPRAASPAFAARGPVSGGALYNQSIPSDEPDGHE